MAWYAKPSSGYTFGSTEGTANCKEVQSILSTLGYTDEAVAGVLGNAMAESGLNPWRWQGDTYSLSGGYGIFQYTPASGYINLGNTYGYYAPNTSTSTTVSGASADDGHEQVLVFANNRLSKWTTYCWRDYWDRTTYADLWTLRSNIISTYGNGTGLTMAQFATIDDIQSATFAFLACFEGPQYPNFDTRYGYANRAYEIIGGTPGPTPTYERIPIWMMKKLGDKNFKRRC